MTFCTTCRTTILWGGTREGTARYCSENCAAAGRQTALAARVPQSVARELAEAIHRGGCPKCRSDAPVDLYKAHWVWSALIVTSWQTTVELSCRKCARKRQLGAFAFCAVLGWWGYVGFVATPVQLIRNVIALATGSKAGAASAELVDVSRSLAAERGYAATEAAEPEPDKPWKRR